MKLFFKFLFFTAIAGFFSSVNAQNIHHNINLNISIADKSVDGTDSVIIPSAFLTKTKESLTFEINAGFTIKSLDTKYKISETKSARKGDSSEIKSKKYLITFTKTNAKSIIIPLQYSGKVAGQITEGAVDYARGFSETPGIICNDGVYFANSTYWLPMFTDTLYTFNVTAKIDSAYGVISQGTRVRNEKDKNLRVISYKSENPSDDFYLIAGKWTEYNKMAGKILVQAELRTPDTTMANSYLKATIGYLELYQKLIGPYPYTKFTLVENFWETGYGMPSFTLLGEKIIRLPFIINSSYPHELLHNYWGNSVYVNNIKGNWCEGLTVYMADHLIREQNNTAVEYRRGTLQKFTDFVNESNDFPVSKFTSRNNSAEEAIGYGKTSMMFEMLRYSLGDDVFKKAISLFYTDNKFKMATFDNIRNAFEKVSGQNLNDFFNQWINRTGAPGLMLSDVKVKLENHFYTLSFNLSQVQKEDVFNVMVPVAIFLEGVDTVIVKNVTLTKREENFTFYFNKRPALINVDPQFNVFRRVSKEEVPPCLSQLYGAKDAAMILPKKSPFIKEYSDLADKWKQTQQVQGNNLEVLFDEDLSDLPDKACWIIGFDNKFAKTADVFNQYTDMISRETLNQVESLKVKGSLVYVFQNPKNKSLTNGFLGSANQTMIGALKRKIIHYSKYGYLGFEGDEGTNVLKGEFPILTSPLSYYIKYELWQISTVSF